MFPRRPLVIAISAAVLLGVGAGARGETTASGLDGVLVLSNGNVLAGTIRRVGDDYLIDAAGATLQVPALQVERFAKSLNEAYEARRRERAGASADSHMELARWCLRLDLLEEASRELLDVRAEDAAHPELAMFESQLRQRLVAAAAVLDSEQRQQRDRQSKARAVVPASVDDDAAEVALDLPEAAQVQFVRSIQPMLVRNCTTGGCHQPGSTQKLQLDRWALEGNGNVELLRRNLAAVLANVDREQPTASPLTQYARTSHGGDAGSGSRPLTAHQATLLLQWLEAVAGADQTSEAQSEAIALAASGSGEAGIGAESVDAEAALDAGLDFGAADPSQEDVVRSDASEPRDEFDPAIFHRRLAERPRAIIPAPRGEVTLDPDALAPAAGATEGAEDASE